MLTIAITSGLWGMYSAFAGLFYYYADREGYFLPGFYGLLGPFVWPFIKLAGK